MSKPHQLLALSNPQDDLQVQIQKFIQLIQQHYKNSILSACFLQLHQADLQQIPEIRDPVTLGHKLNDLLQTVLHFEKIRPSICSMDAAIELHISVLLTFAKSHRAVPLELESKFKKTMMQECHLPQRLRDTAFNFVRCFWLPNHINASAPAQALYQGPQQEAIIPEPLQETAAKIQKLLEQLHQAQLPSEQLSLQWQERWEIFHDICKSKFQDPDLPLLTWEYDVFPENQQLIEQTKEFIVNNRSVLNRAASRLKFPFGKNNPYNKCRELFIRLKQKIQDIEASEEWSAHMSTQLLVYLSSYIPLAPLENKILCCAEKFARHEAELLAAIPPNSDTFFPHGEGDIATVFELALRSRVSDTRLLHHLQTCARAVSPFPPSLVITVKNHSAPIQTFMADLLNLHGLRGQYRIDPYTTAIHFPDRTGLETRNKINTFCAYLIDKGSPLTCGDVLQEYLVPTILETLRSFNLKVSASSENSFTIEYPQQQTWVHRFLQSRIDLHLMLDSLDKIEKLYNLLTHISYTPHALGKIAQEILHLGDAFEVTTSPSGFQRTMLVFEMPSGNPPAVLKPYQERFIYESCSKPGVQRIMLSPGFLRDFKSILLPEPAPTQSVLRDHPALKDFLALNELCRDCGSSSYLTTSAVASNSLTLAYLLSYWDRSSLAQSQCELNIEKKRNRITEGEFDDLAADCLELMTDVEENYFYPLLNKAINYLDFVAIFLIGYHYLDLTQHHPINIKLLQAESVILRSVQQADLSEETLFGKFCFVRDALFKSTLRPEVLMEFACVANAMNPESLLAKTLEKDAKARVIQPGLAQLIRIPQQKNLSDSEIDSPRQSISVSP